MIENSLAKKKRSFKGPLLLCSAVAVLGLGSIFYFSSSDSNNATNPLSEITTENTFSQSDDNSSNQPHELSLYASRSLHYPDLTNGPIAKVKLKPEDHSGPLIVLPTNNTVISLAVQKGDSLSTLFNKAGLPISLMYEVLDSSADAKKYLTQLNVNQTFVFTLDGAGDLLSLVTKPNMLNTFSVIKQGNSYQFQHNALTPTYKEVYAYGVINSSLFAAADKADVPHSMILEIANAFGYDIDFALDLRQGDEFEAVFEQKLVKGKVVGTGNLLAARFVNRGKEFTAVRYVSKKGVVAYYRADGTSMKRAFIRTPVDFTRISSKFTLGRYHPILNKIRAHKGVDYAAPTGTAIRAAGAGRIVERGWKGGYGNAIVIQHGKTYSTLYGHMSRFAPDLKVGSHVQQGQTIGYVGMTGLATGPHLHYEFRVNGQHVDPLSVKLPMSDPIPATEKARFLAISQPLMKEMGEKKATLLAAKSVDEPTEQE